jgi:hypothetical protein
LFVCSSKDPILLFRIYKTTLLFLILRTKPSSTNDSCHNAVSHRQHFTVRVTLQCS